MSGPWEDFAPSGGPWEDFSDKADFSNVVEGHSADPKIGQPEELTWMEQLAGAAPGWMTGGNMRGSAVGGVMHGAAKPIAGAWQWLAHAFPKSFSDSVDAGIKREEGEYQAARKAAGREGFDAAELAGQVLSPANLVIAAKAPMAATKLGRFAQGMGLGGATAGMEPVLEPEKGFWKEKTGQVFGGALAGGLMNPIVGKVGDMVVRRLQSQGSAARSAAQVDEGIEGALADLGQSINEIPPAQLDALRAKVAGALQSGRAVDPAALMRQGDFEALGIAPTLGQLTRDPIQFARERALRGVEGVGEPLMSRLQQQANQLQERVSAPAAGAKDAYNSGSQLMESLRGTDETLRKHVSGLYQEARASAGKDLDVPLQGLAQDYAAALENFGDKIPGAIRARMASFGLDPSMPSNQRAVFTIEDGERLLKAINSHIGNDPVTNRALGEIKGAIRSAITGVDASGGPFAPAVRAAAQRFELHEAIPALKAAAEGSIAPDDFVRRFVVTGKTNEVKALGQVLKQADPAAWQEARAQIAESLRRAALGENVAGDGAFNARKFMEQAKRIGTDKLSAFFSTEEVLGMMRTGRVGGYINQQPATAAVNNSNTASAAWNLLGYVPGASTAASVVGKVAGAVRNKRDVDHALAATVPKPRAPLDDRQTNYLRYLMGLSGAASGAAAGGAIGQKPRVERDADKRRRGL